MATVNPHGKDTSFRQNGVGTVFFRADAILPKGHAKLTADQRERLIDFIVEKFGASRATAADELEVSGFPIRAEDVVVAFDHRYFT